MFPLDEKIDIQLMEYEFFLLVLCDGSRDILNKKHNKQYSNSVQINVSK